MSSKFPERLRQARELRGFNQSQLAEKSGLAASAINHFEQGRRAPSFDNLKRLANALNVTTDFLVGRTEEPGLCGPTADKVFRNAEKLSSTDLDALAMMAEVLARKAQARPTGRDDEQETSR